MKKLLTICLLMTMGVLGALAQSENYQNDAIKNIMTRTSIRKYTDQPVTKEKDA